MDENTQQVITQLGDKLDSYINVLAEKLGVAAEYVYPLFVKQQMIEGIADLSMVVLGWIIIIICLVYGVKIGEKKNWADGWYYILFAIAVILSIPVLFETVGISEPLTKILNPEYAAIQDIIKMVK